jgi:hypothetical protein
MKELTGENKSCWSFRWLEYQVLAAAGLFRWKWLSDNVITH